MFSIIHAYYISGWITLYIAFQFAILAPYNHNKKLYLYFILMTLCVGVYQHYTGSYYDTHSVENAVYAIKIQLYAASFVPFILYLLFSEYTNARISRFFALVLLLFTCVIIVKNFISPYGIRFEMITASSRFVLPWGETARNYFGEPDPLINIFRFIFVIILLWGMWRAKVHYAKNRYESLLLALFIITMIFSLWVGYLIDSKKIDFVYIGGFAYFFLVITMTISLTIRILKQQKELEDTTIRLRQENNMRIQAEKDLIFRAEHDELTGLFNRRMILEQLDKTMKQSERTSSKVAVLFIDIDYFKGINDSMGHVIGDEVLVNISRNLMKNMRTVDHLARLGGDEFCLVISSIESPDDASKIAMKLLEILQQRILIDQHELYLSGSIGISIYPDDGQTPIDLLRNADSAMYKAKQERNSYQFYTDDMTKRAFERVSMATSIRQALDKEEFVVYYQPQINGQSGKLIGMEALVRWNHPTLGFVSPDKFIALAEETGLIVPLDRWVMKTAMRQIETWYSTGLNPGVLSINLSIKQLHQDDFITVFKNIFKDAKFRPEWLELEVTESQIMTNPEEAIVILNQISDRGIHLAIDDFGTGYSSLSYLKRLPINKLKIDKSFVDGLPDDDEDASIARAVIALAKSLKLSVIAEGVETEEQKDFLIQNGCENIQGYFYGRPMSASDFEQKFLRQ